MQNMALAYVPSGNFQYEIKTTTFSGGVRHTILVPTGLVRRKLWFGHYNPGGDLNAQINCYLNGSLICQMPHVRGPIGGNSYGFDAQFTDYSGIEPPLEAFAMGDGTVLAASAPHHLTVDMDQIDFNILGVNNGGGSSWSYLACWSQNITPPL